MSLTKSMLENRDENDTKKKSRVSDENIVDARDKLVQYNICSVRIVRRRLSIVLSRFSHEFDTYSVQYVTFTYDIVTCRFQHSIHLNASRLYCLEQFLDRIHKKHQI